MKSLVSYVDFFLHAMKPNRKLITGVICGVRVERIEEPLMQEIGYLDELPRESSWKILRSSKPIPNTMKPVKASRSNDASSHPNRASKPLMSLQALLPALTAMKQRSQFIVFKPLLKPYLKKMAPLYVFPMISERNLERAE